MQPKNSFGIKLLSVVVPAFKQERTIVEDIKNIIQTLEGLHVKYELIIVVDGMIDGTYQKISKLKSSKVKIIAYKQNQGKGQAVRLGMMLAKGDVIGFIDAGMDIHPAGLKMLLNHMEWYDADIIVGSKLHPVSKVNYPFYRTILSWGYRMITATLFGFKIRDTQVGLKFFKREVVKDVLPRLLVKRYAFDIEMLAVSHSMGYWRIYEAPIEINFHAATITSKTMLRVIMLMLWDTFAVFYRLKIIHYYERKSHGRNVLSKKNPSAHLVLTE